MKCLNCGKTEFEEMPLYDIYCTEGGAVQLVDAYVCLNCGRVELYMPKELIEKKLKAKENARTFVYKNEFPRNN